MPAYHVQRTIRIDAPEAKVKPAIQDFSEWPKWSPWLCMEPQAQVNVHGTPGQSGHGYNWDGNLVGAGEMEIESIDSGTQEMELNFLRPFKSRADVRMEVKPVGDNQTELTWHMDSKVPFFLFFLVNMMKTMIGHDYQRGLKMLKEYVETGSVCSDTKLEGTVDVASVNYVGVSDSCNLADIGDSMKKTLPAAHRLATDNNLEIVGPPGAMYTKFDMKSQQCEYIAFMQVKEPADISGAECGEIPNCKAIKVTHKGDYAHLGNAWSTAMSKQRYDKVKPLKNAAPFELYLNDPCDFPKEEWLVDILVPIRG